jgi:hypothetical protein
MYQCLLLAHGTVVVMSGGEGILRSHHQTRIASLSILFSPAPVMLGYEGSPGFCFAPSLLGLGGGVDVASLMYLHDFLGADLLGKEETNGWVEGRGSQSRFFCTLKDPSVFHAAQFHT